MARIFTLEPLARSKDDDGQESLLNLMVTVTRFYLLFRMKPYKYCGEIGPI